jgi:capsular polysaccharide biosynthesis protein
MVIQVHLPDNVAATYQKRAKSRKITMSKVLAEQLKRFIEVDAQDRVIVIPARTRSRIEKILSKGGHIQDAEDLVNRITSLARIQIEGVDLEFDQAEKEQIARRAEKNSIAFEEEIRRTVEGMKWQFFDNLV